MSDPTLLTKENGMNDVMLVSERLNMLPFADMLLITASMVFLSEMSQNAVATDDAMNLITGSTDMHNVASLMTA